MRRARQSEVNRLRSLRKRMIFRVRRSVISPGRKRKWMPAIVKTNPAWWNKCPPNRPPWTNISRVPPRNSLPICPRRSISMLLVRALLQAISTISAFTLGSHKEFLKNLLRGRKENVRAKDGGILRNSMVWALAKTEFLRVKAGLRTFQPRID